MWGPQLILVEAAARVGKRVLEYFQKAVSLIVALRLVPLLSAAEPVYYSTGVSLLESGCGRAATAQVQTGCMIMFYPSADPIETWYGKLHRCLLAVAVSVNL